MLYKDEEELKYESYKYKYPDEKSLVNFLIGFGVLLFALTLWAISFLP